MRGRAALTTLVGLVALGALAPPAPVWCQTGTVTAIRAGRLFDPKAGANLSNHIVLIRGDRIPGTAGADRC